jgi:hypothetical protein
MIRLVVLFYLSNLIDLPSLHYEGVCAAVAGWSGESTEMILICYWTEEILIEETRGARESYREE